jgi:hypothetical protein
MPRPLSTRVCAVPFRIDVKVLILSDICAIIEPALEIVDCYDAQDEEEENIHNDDIKYGRDGNC